MERCRLINDDLYFKIGSVCLCHGQHAIGDRRYFLAPCDKRKHTVYAHQQAASQVSTDSAWRHPVWLPHSSLRFQRPVGRRSYHNKPRLTGEVCVTPQATISVVKEEDTKVESPSYVHIYFAR